MRAKKVSCFFTVLLLFAALFCSVNALSENTASIRGEGVTIDLTFPKEAHPGESIWHNATLKANTALTLYNLTLVIKAPVNSIWQEATSWSLSNRVLSENAVLTEEINFQLSSNVNGTLQCFIYVNTTQSTYYLSTIFFTTHVSELTFGEMQRLYNEMLANYTGLQTDYEALNNDYNDLFASYTTLQNEYNQLVADYNTLLDDNGELSANYSTLFANYTALLSEHNQLTADYNSQVAQYNSLLGDYETLDAAYGTNLDDLVDLQLGYKELNSTYYSLQEDNNLLEEGYFVLNQKYISLKTQFDTLQENYDVSEGAVNSYRVVMFMCVVAVGSLIALIVYLKRKKEEPYVVIRKETVNMKSDVET
jgi:predicted nuclease with TOPRIM domain